MSTTPKEYTANATKNGTDRKSFSKKHRIWQFSLILIILLFLIVLAVLLYNELANEKKLTKYFDEMTETESLLHKLDSNKLNIVKSQEKLLGYLIHNNQANMENYFASVSETQDLLQNLSEIKLPASSSDVKMSEKKVDVDKFSRLVDSVKKEILFKSNLNSPEVISRFKELNYDDLNIKTTIETSVQVDSVKKKKLFGRLGDAIKGDVKVQKEKTEHIVTIEYGQEKTHGSLDEQMKVFLNKITKYYENEALNIYRTVSKAKLKKQNLLAVNAKIQQKSKQLLEDYENALLEEKEILNKKYNVQYSQNRTIRLYGILAIVILLILFTIIVIYLTKATYGYEKKLAQAKVVLDKSLKMKDKIVSMISHDIRAPLNTITLYVMQLVKNETDPEKLRAFNSIIYTARSSSLLANRILDFSKSEQGLLSIHQSKFNLHKEVNQILDIFEPLANEKNIRLINHNEIHKDLIVNFDKPKLQRLYLNLLDNAIKYTKDGKIEVKSELKNLGQNYRFSLCVADTGKGIPNEKLSKIMEPFEQMEASEVNSIDIGAGLGLHLCKEIIDLFHGKISVESKVDEGTKVSLYLIMEH